MSVVTHYLLVHVRAGSNLDTIRTALRDAGSFSAADVHALLASPWFELEATAEDDIESFSAALRAAGAEVDVSESWPEADYLRTLRGERHMYAWCLRTMGHVSAERATESAEFLYPYEEPSRLRGLAFHITAWSNALEHLQDVTNLRTDEELASPSPEFEAEYARWVAEYDRSTPPDRT